MTTRNRIILRLLTENMSRYTTIDEIAEETGSGARTIHRDLEGLERSLRVRGVRMERRRGYGIRLVDPLPDRLAIDVLDTPTDGPADSGQRPSLVLLYLLAAGTWTKLSDVAMALYVTDSTISSDIGTLESWLPSRVIIERQKGLGIRIDANEVDARLLFLSTFPGLYPLYVINADPIPGRTVKTGDERFLDAIGVRQNRDIIIRTINRIEDSVGYQFSPAYRGYLYSYLFISFKRLGKDSRLEEAGIFRTATPKLYQDAAVGALRGEFSTLVPSETINDEETAFFGRVLASCDPANPPLSSVSEYLGDLEPNIEAMLEHSLSRLEEKERIWLHDDRALLNYFRMSMAAAARRIDLGVSSWSEFGLRPFPGIEDSPESAVLVSQFLSDLGRILKEPTPGIVRREIYETSLAVKARLEAYHSRSATDRRVKILCYEGLGMSNYILSLCRDVFPRGTVFNIQWESNFEKTMEPGQYDLVISTFPLRLSSTKSLLLNGDDPPSEIRRQLEEAVKELDAEEHKPRPVTGESEDQYGSDETDFSLSDVMTVINGFFVIDRSPTVSLIEQAVNALDRGDCDIDAMTRDFERRETYGSLSFEEWNMRILHCRTEGISEPRAGVIQSKSAEETVLVLAAPVSASQSKTHALSEIVIALSEYPDFPEVLAKGNRRTIQARLMTLFGRGAER